MKGIGNLGALMKQAQQMQANMAKAQEELASVEVEGQSGAGAVKVVMTCKHDVRRVTIDPSVMVDRGVLGVLIASPSNDAARMVADGRCERRAGGGDDVFRRHGVVPPTER